MWYYMENDEKKGPVETTVLRDLRERNVVAPDTPVWTDGMDEWVPLHEVRLGGEGPEARKDAPNQEATSADGHTQVTAHSVGEERGRSRKIGIVVLLLFATFGLATYLMYPFLSHEYLYDRSTVGVHSRYPLPVEKYALLKKGSLVRFRRMRKSVKEG